MTSPLDNGILLLLLKVYGAMILLGPVLLRAQFRFKAKLNPQLVPVESLPPDVRQFMALRVKSIADLGFEPVGYVNLGNMTTNTGSFMALFSNSRTLEWADVSVVKSATKMAGYIEFITRCSNDAQVDTNTNSIAPVLFPSPSYHVFRFPQVRDAFTLYRAHRMLVQQSTGGSKPELPPRGQELAELKRRLERYGPRQQERGYMYLDGAGDVGVIPSVTEPFCDHCDRVRVTAEGKFRTCLFALEEFDLRAILRGSTGAHDEHDDVQIDDRLASEIERAVGTKWAGHRIGQVNFVRPARSMSQIGG